MKSFGCFCGIFLILVTIIVLIVGFVIVLRPKSLSFIDEKETYVR